MDAKKYLERKAGEEQSLKEKICDAILALPDNPAIKRMPGQKNCFIIQKSDLGDKWTPEYHSFFCQYRAIAKEIMSRRLIDALKWLVEILDARKFRTGNPPHTYRLHPAVIRNINKCIGDIDTK